MDDRTRVIEALADSQVFHEYAAAFRAITGISLCLEAPTSNTNFEALETMPFFENPGAQKANLVGSVFRASIPVRDGVKTVAILRTNHNYEGKLSRKTPANHAGHLPFGDESRISSEDFAPLCKLLEIFAEQLGHLANRIVLHQNHCEPGIITRAKQHIHSKYQTALQLKEVAKQVHVSSYYLCKLFKKSTGLNFSNYIARVRVDAAKILLDKNPNFRINEIAIEVGFLSLTHFNRVFKRFIGLSPRAYRKRLTAPHMAPIEERTELANKKQLETNKWEDAFLF